MSRRAVHHYYGGSAINNYFNIAPGDLLVHVVNGSVIHYDIATDDDDYVVYNDDGTYYYDDPKHVYDATASGGLPDGAEHGATVRVDSDPAEDVHVR